MKLSRRGFFAGLASTLAAPAIVRSGILMPVRVVTPVISVFLTPDMVTRAAMRLFFNTNQFLRDIDRQYAAQFEFSAATIGQPLKIRLPH